MKCNATNGQWFRISGNLIMVPLVRADGELVYGTWDCHPSRVWTEIDSIYAKQGFWYYEDWLKKDIQRIMDEEYSNS